LEISHSEKLMKIRNFMPAAACVTALMASVPSVHAATEIIDSDFSTCNTLNCSRTSIAAYVGSFGGSVTPWVAKFLATAGNCLRLDVAFVNQASLEMTVVAPNGTTVYRSTSGGAGGAGAPIVKVSPTIRGYYTVVVSSSNGAAINKDFHLSFGQYGPSNVNCSAPTAPLP